MAPAWGERKRATAEVLVIIAEQEFMIEQLQNYITGR
jgi:hypothetical protein